ncbi:autophagy-related protein 18f-like isoform X1 [Cucurbita moschata]|uniref:Autophagy-related protein 18f-like isoform X1 n=1 Tax=Cucurbita moschata TaxID=3662 RepID=A0A6J1FPV0_CUCMO|nr:autophagy-related protein 18f-like isoform X1 [Cucurbita moschata]
MGNDRAVKQQGTVARSGRAHEFISSSFRAFSSYMKIVSAGASTVARSAASVASSLVDKDDEANGFQVNWAGFDKLEWDDNVVRRVLLLGYCSGFQVWDVEEANNVQDLVSRYDGSVSYMQVLPRPIPSMRSGDKFTESRPLLVLSAYGSITAGFKIQDRIATSGNAAVPKVQEPADAGFMPTFVRFYSLKSQTYVHELKFRSVVYSVRCSPLVVAISLVTQIHCINATTLETEHIIHTNPVASGFLCSGGGIGYGPLALGSRWLAYSGSPITASNVGRVTPQHLKPSASLSHSSLNGSLVAHYAKESSKQLAAGLVTIGDKGIKKLSRYYSELLPDSNNSHQHGAQGLNGIGYLKDHVADADSVGMVIVKDIISKSVITQFRAHKSPISALCFDPSGTILVTASIQGHNINVFNITPSSSSNSSVSSTGASYRHLYRLQRGFTNAVIQDISFSYDSNWIMISSSRGTSHLFAINPAGGQVNFPSTSSATRTDGLVVPARQTVRLVDSGLHMPRKQNECATRGPITLSAVSRIHHGSNGWRGTVSSAAAAATGRIGSVTGAIASAFHNCKGNALHMDHGSSEARYHILVFTPTGSMIQYVLRVGLDSAIALPISSTALDLVPEFDARVAVEAVQKWNISQKQNRRARDNNVDIYGDNGALDCNKNYCVEMNGKPSVLEASGTVSKAKTCTEEQHHLYISEAELQMHADRTPLWTKPEIYFQVMARDGVKGDEIDQLGETEIERIPTRMVEARSKDLVPVFNHLQLPKISQTRSLNRNSDQLLLHQKSDLFENGRQSRGNDASPNGSVISNGPKGTGKHGYKLVTETKGVVNGYEGPRSLHPELDNVNNCTESLSMECCQPKSVNNHESGVEVEDDFEGICDLFD